MTVNEHAKLLRACYHLMARSIPINSKFRNSDLDNLWSFLRSMDSTRLEEVWNCQLAISQVTQKEIDENCQVSDILK